MTTITIAGLSPTHLSLLEDYLESLEWCLDPNVRQAATSATVQRSTATMPVRLAHDLAGWIEPAQVAAIECGASPRMTASYDSLAAKVQKALSD